MYADPMSTEQKTMKYKETIKHTAKTAKMAAARRPRKISRNACQAQHPENTPINRTREAEQRGISTDNKHLVHEKQKLKRMAHLV